MPHLEIGVTAPCASLMTPLAGIARNRRPEAAEMKLLVVDDHVLILDALRGVLKELDSGAIILEASRWSDAARLLTEHDDLSLILLDLVLPDYDGFTALKDLQEQHTGIPVVVLSATRDRDSIVKALELGAAGFIPKSGSVEVLLDALRLVCSGGVYIPPEILSRSEASAKLAPSSASGRPTAGPASPADLGLTPRQIDVLALMMRGKSNKAICQILDLAEQTVKGHVTAILRDLKVSNRTEAVVVVGALDWKLPKCDVGAPSDCLGPKGQRVPFGS